MPEETAELLVEVHIPLTPDEHVADGEYPYPWIDEVMEFIADLDDSGDVELYDDGEEWEGNYVFRIAGAVEEALLAIARRVAGLPGIPSGVFAIVTDTSATETGAGTRVEF